MEVNAYLFIVFLFLSLPGLLFTFVVSRSSLRKNIGSSFKSSHLVTSFAASVVLIGLFEKYFKHLSISILRSFPSVGALFPADFSYHLENRNLVIDLLNISKILGSFEQIVLIMHIVSVFTLILYSFAIAISFNQIVRGVVYFLTKDPYTLLYYLVNIVDRVLFDLFIPIKEKIFHRFPHRLAQTAIIFFDNILSFIFILTAIICILGSFLIICSLIVLSILIRVVLRLFTNPNDSLLDDQVLFGNIPILEIVKDNGILYRGVFDKYFNDPTSDGLGVICLSDVISIKRVDESRLLHRNNRDVLAFSKNNGKFLIPYTRIQNVNKWILSGSNFNWSFSIDSEQSFALNKWYFDIIFKYQKNSIELNNYEFIASPEYGFRFLIELLNSLEKTYIKTRFKWIYRRQFETNLIYLIEQIKLFIRLYRANRGQLTVAYKSNTNKHLRLMLAELKRIKRL